MPDESPSTLKGMPPNPVRCIECAYVLEGLASSRCPECGRPFDLNDVTTYTRNPPLVRWRLWLPGLLLAIFSGVVTFGIVLAIGGIGMGFTFGVPVSIGAILGYRCRVKMLMLVVLSLTALTGVIAAIISMQLAGLLCSVVVLVIAAIPVIVGACLGIILRQRLKESGFDQRSYLPVLLIFAFPLAWSWVESQWPKTPTVEKVLTTVDLEMPVEQAWNRMRFYEELTHEPPWLFELGAPRPIRTLQSSVNGEDRYVCIYKRGYVIKHMTKTEFLSRSAFEIVEQKIGFERSIRLRGGSFAFTSIDNDQTRITLTTEYEPRLHPRWCWRPFEKHIIHTLHGYILEGMVMENQKPRSIAMSQAR